jgi:hypothetical protein
MQWYISLLVQTVLSRDNGLMHLFEKPRPSYFLPFGEYTTVELPHSVGKSLQGEFQVVQDDREFGFGLTQV